MKIHQSQGLTSCFINQESSETLMTVDRLNKKIFSDIVTIAFDPHSP